SLSLSLSLSLFQPGFTKFWKKIFLSEASVAVIQDTFWWIFLDRFNKEKGLDGDKDLVFDRVADSFVALFTTINTDVKDKVLPVYPDCYAQSLYALYCEAFPESTPTFDEDFKQYLVNLAHEWITGLKPVPGTYNNWNVNGLKPGVPKGTKADENVVAAKQMIQAAALNKNVSITLDIESFTKLVDRLGNDKQTSPSISPHGFTRESTKTTTITSGSWNTPLPTTQTKLRVKQVIESHQIGPGPEYERVKFNTQGRSPLISHYLYMRQLRDLKQPGQKLRRTEIAKLPPPGQTYQQLIQNTLSLSNALSKEYQKICDETNQGIIDLERRKVEMNKEIDALQKELLFTRNPHDLKILCEKIAALREKSKELPMTVDSKSSEMSDSRASSIIEDNLIKSPKS
ncbi:protein FAM227B, partial [Patella vulgata]|uniref:protein FAM227B n=1 Tax=Patella vulgata TaxID=6465 RepID=UPI0021807CDB